MQFNPDSGKALRLSREWPVLCFLLVTAWYLLFMYARVIGLGLDLWQALIAMQNRGLPSLPSTWFAGRPFLGLSWNLAAFFGRGSIAGYETFQFATLLLSSVLVYVFIRLVVPGARFWAFVAAALKLAWAANQEIFDNSGLPIYFVEMLFWLALVLFVSGALGRLRGLLAAGALVAISLALVIAAGTYQSIWPALVLAPAGLVFVMGWNWRNFRTWLLVWYASSISSMAFSWWQLGELGKTSSVRVIPERIWLGIVAATASSYSAPLRFATVFHVDDLWVLILLVFAFIAVAAFSGLQTGRLEWTYFWRIALLSLLWIACSIAPPATIHVPSYPDRTLHFASFGSIALFLGVVAFLFSRWRGGMLIALALSAWLFAGSAKRVHETGAYIADNSIPDLRFWKQMMMLLPSVKEGTVVKLRSKPGNFSYGDLQLTAIFRALTATKYSIVLGDSPTDNTTNLDLANRLEQRHPHGVVDRIPNYALDLPVRLRAPVTQYIDPASVITIEWDSTLNRLHVLPEESSMGRILPISKSWLAHVLFSGTEGDWMSNNLTFINEGQTLHFASGPPDRKMALLRIYDPSTAVAWFDGDITGGALGPDGQCARVALGNAEIVALVPVSGRYSIRCRISRLGTERVTVAYNNGPETELNVTGTPQEWQTKLLSAGLQRIIFRTTSTSGHPAISILGPKWSGQ